MKRFTFLAIISLLAVTLLAGTAGARSGPRIELDQDNPSIGDTVTFTVTQARSADPQVQLRCGDRIAFDPPTSVLLDVTQPADSEFLLDLDQETTCIAWLLKKNEPLTGTLFWVAP